MSSPGTPVFGQADPTVTAGVEVKSSRESPEKIPWDLEITDGRLRKGGILVPATMGTIVAYLRDKNPANVVLAPGVGSIEITDIKLLGTVWDETLEALRVASGNAFAWSPAAGGYALTLEPGAAANRAGRAVQVYNLTGYLQGKDEKEADSALNEIKQITLSTLGDLRSERSGPVDLPTFRFHPGAKLLVLTGSPDCLELARKVALAFPGVTSSESAGGGTVGAFGTGGGFMGYGAGGVGGVTPKALEMQNAFRKRYGLAPLPNSPPAPPAAAPVAPPVAPAAVPERNLTAPALAPARPNTAPVAPGLPKH